MSNNQIKNPNLISDYLKALSNPKRMEIFMRIAAGCYLGYNSSKNGEICACVGELSQGLNIGLSTVSHHIKELRQAGLVRVERRGQKVECSVVQSALYELAEYFDALKRNAVSSISHDISNMSTSEGGDG